MVVADGVGVEELEEALGFGVGEAVGGADEPAVGVAEGVRDGDTVGCGFGWHLCLFFGFGFGWWATASSVGAAVGVGVGVTAGDWEAVATE